MASEVSTGFQLGGGSKPELGRYLYKEEAKSNGNQKTRKGPFCGCAQVLSIPGVDPTNACSVRKQLMRKNSNQLLQSQTSSFLANSVEKEVIR